MLYTASGVKIPFPDNVEEKYLIQNNRIRFNISFEKLKPFLMDFTMKLSEPLFLVINLPLTEQTENKMRKSDVDAFHAEVLYLDGQSREQIFDILNQFGEILLNDGISQFGIASHETGDEIFVQKYKIIDIYSYDCNKYLSLLKEYCISVTENLVTVWDTFSIDSPGECNKVTINNKDIYDVVKELKKLGMYSAKIIEN